MGDRLKMSSKEKLLMLLDLLDEEDIEALWEFALWLGRESLSPEVMALFEMDNDRESAGWDHALWKDAKAAR